MAFILGARGSAHSHLRLPATTAHTPLPSYTRLLCYCYYTALGNIFLALAISALLAELLVRTLSGQVGVVVVVVSGRYSPPLGTRCYPRDARLRALT